MRGDSPKLNLSTAHCGRPVEISIPSFGGGVVLSDSSKATDLFVAADKLWLVVLDVTMPDMDGLEVLRRLKADPATTGVRVVMFSATAGEQYAHGARALGAGGRVRGEGRR